MDGDRAAGSGDEQAGPNGPNLTQNPFDPAALLGKAYTVHLNDIQNPIFLRAKAAIAFSFSAF